jgi:hypothetical protein
VAVTASAQLLPDLVIDSITVNPNRVGANEPFTLTFTMRNAGAAPAADFTYAINLAPHFTLDRVNDAGNPQIACANEGGWVWCRPKSPPPLPLLPGSRVTASFTVHVNKEGNTTSEFIAQADRDSKITESNESNNIRVGGKLTIIVRPKVTASCTCPTTKLAANTPFTVNCTVKNTGTVTASGTGVNLKLAGPGYYTVTSATQTFSPSLPSTETTVPYDGTWSVGTLTSNGALPWSFTIAGRSANILVRAEAFATDTLVGSGSDCNISWQ